MLAAEAVRHDRIEEVVESTELRTFFVVEGDHEFTGVPAPLPDERRGFPWA